MVLTKTYSHREVEGKWYNFWQEEGYFRPEGRSLSQVSVFSMVIPPPNITGSLHLGHALNNTLQDILCRYKRMDGYRVLWIPGTDHASIATENVVERKLLEQGVDKRQLGREKFIERVWQWREESGRTIVQQLKRLGVSCDWSRERFTMDEGLSRAVREVFVRLYEEGLIYRGLYLINWCPRCRTALSDLEVEQREADGHLYYLRYPTVDDQKTITIATTRPETMLGDTAVAVNPEDKRYQDLIGKTLLLPVLARPIPVITDSRVDKDFGTGALKITPAHDFIDFEIGQHHGLQSISVMDEQGRMTKEAGPYAGLDRYECRRKLIEELKRSRVLIRTEPYKLLLGYCYRCQTIVEPFLSNQWFVRIKPLAEAAISAVKEGKTQFFPPGWEKTYFGWMENIRDWCISRQLWWGHRIPAWYCDACQATLVSRKDLKNCIQCGSTHLRQDSDVLDTWFSSGLWPFSTMGWPEATADLKTFYPTSTLVTSFDIIFFWVARMMMLGLKFMGEVPFRHVYIHALVRDEYGQKMSKSKGNIVDPLGVMDTYGTDALRFTLAALSAMGRDIRLSEERITGYQNFVNKLWNAARFVLMNISDGVRSKRTSLDSLRTENLNLADQWILSRLASTIEESRKAIDSYRFNEFAHLLYQFTWHEFCDWYIEMSKLSLNGTLGDDPLKTQRILAGVLEQILLMLHPLMPFVTEEIWQVLTEKEENRKTASAMREKKRSIMVQEYARAKPEWIQPEVEQRVRFLTEVIRSIRNLRTEMNCPPSKEVKVTLFGTEQNLSFLKSQEPYLSALARAVSVEYLTVGERPKGAATGVVGDTELYLPLGDMIDPKEEKKRLEKEVRKAEEELARIQKKLANKEFLAKAKEDVVQKERGKAEQFEDKIRTLNRSLERILEIQQVGG
ncbi:MAG: valine--tRNA ligase [Candidatus Binatia bacterium]